MAVCTASTLEAPKANAAPLIPPNWRARAETVLPWQFACPGVPAAGTVSPVKEKVILNVCTGLPSTISVPIRSQSGFKLELRIQACKSGANGVPGATIGFGAERYRKFPV